MAELKLYNTLTRTKETFVPLDPAQVRMYVCGPTVYDYAHIGNARPVIVFDVLFRLLRHLGKLGVWDGGKGETQVTYARNITDVDDKINDRAARDYPDLPLNEAIRKVTEATNAQFQADVTALGCLPPTHQPRATEHIDEMKALCERLVQRGIAYVAEGHVLFSPAAMDAAKGPLPRYGKLANRSLDEMIAGARVDVAPYKKDATDFVLWKPSSENEPGWLSPCGIKGKGRPGWHIECSAMSMAKLLQPFGGGLECDDPVKNTFDIHGGGIDLVFPHHENEIAQSCCAFGSPRMANIWMHNGFLQVEGQKMSKSLGNFVTINELLATEKFGGTNWIGPILRLAMLKTHYRQPIDWTVRGLQEAQNDFRNFAELAPRYAANPIIDNEFVACLLDDLNTSDALTRLRQLRDEATKGNVDSGRAMLGSLRLLGLFEYSFSLKLSVSGDDGTPENFLNEALNQLADSFPASLLAEKMIKKFGRNSELVQALLKFAPDTVVAYLRAAKFDFVQVLKLDTSRLEARAAKNWAESDRIRDELAGMGIQLKDGKGPDGQPVTTWEVKR